uniref:Uncharacterized protein n=1 Tax=Arundo donax TaxID=35708 RepID=A0A0A8ZI19_ARUDO
MLVRPNAASSGLDWLQPWEREELVYFCLFLCEEGENMGR